MKNRNPQIPIVASLPKASLSKILAPARVRGLTLGEQAAYYVEAMLPLLCQRKLRGEPAFKSEKYEGGSAIEAAFSAHVYSALVLLAEEEKIELPKLLARILAEALAIKTRSQGKLPGYLLQARRLGFK